MIDKIRNEWLRDDRWRGIRRDYSPEDVLKLRPALLEDHVLAKFAAVKFWNLLNSRSYVHALGTLTGAQAVQMVKAGLEAIYLSGWQVAADANLAGETYPDQSLYPSNSVPALVRRLNNAMLRADEILALESKSTLKSVVPIVADAEAGWGGPCHAFEVMKGMIKAGAAAVHFEDQLGSAKKCGHLGGKVLVPTSSFIDILRAARLAADVLDVPTVLIARTDAESAGFLTYDIDPNDQPFVVPGARTREGYYKVKQGTDAAIARALAYAPYADVLWFETGTPDIEQATKFAEAIHAQFPGKLLAYNCSPSFPWRKKFLAKYKGNPHAEYLAQQDINEFNRKLGELGYRFQFVTLAGWHLNNLGTYKLASDYRQRGVSAYVDLQDEEFALEPGYTAAKHQAEVGNDYFDKVLNLSTCGGASTAAMKGSTEDDFHGDKPSGSPVCNLTPQDKKPDDPPSEK